MRQSLDFDGIKALFTILIEVVLIDIKVAF